MKFTSLFLLLIVTSCNALNPEIFSLADDVLRDVVTVSVDKEAFEGEREVHIHVDIENTK